MSDAKSTAVTPATRPYENLIKLLKGQWEIEKEITGGGAFDIASQVIDAIEAAETIDDVFAANESGIQDIENYLNVPVDVVEVNYRPSAERFVQNGQSLGFYVIMDIVTLEGEIAKVTTGAPNVVASTHKLQRMGAISEAKPLRCKIISTATANGNLYRLAKPDYKVKASA